MISSPMIRGTLRGRGILGDTIAEPLFGQVVADVPTLEAAILAEPSAYPDGTPVFVTTIDYNVPDGSDPITETGWVLVYEGVPVAVTPPSKLHYQGWIDTYSPPSGATVYIDPDDDHTGGFVTNDDGAATPTRNVPATICGAFRPMPASSISGGYVNADSDALDPADLIDVRYSI